MKSINVFSDTREKSSCFSFQTDLLSINVSKLINIFWMLHFLFYISTYRKAAGSNTSSLEAHVGFFRLLRGHSSITSSKRWVGGVRKWQFLMIYSTVNHQRSGWVGLKKSKTWWRNTWMPPIIWNLHWNFTDVSMLSKEVTSSLSRKYFNKFENFQCPIFWTNIIPSLDVFLHLWHSLNAKSAVHWKLGHCIFASRNMYL